MRRILLSLGQTQQLGTVPYGYVFRHKDVRICTVSAIAFYLFLRFQAGGEQWPAFDDEGLWQDIKLLRSRDGPTVALKYAAQLKVIKTDFMKHGLDLRAWTHSGRKLGVQHGERLDI